MHESCIGLKRPSLQNIVQNKIFNSVTFVHGVFTFLSWMSGRREVLSSVEVVVPIKKYCVIHPELKLLLKTEADNTRVFLTSNRL